jgi:hypothetical protein
MVLAQVLTCVMESYADVCTHPPPSGYGQQDRTSEPPFYPYSLNTSMHVDDAIKSTMEHYDDVMRIFALRSQSVLFSHDNLDDIEHGKLGVLLSAIVHQVKEFGKPPKGCSVIMNVLCSGTDDDDDLFDGVVYAPRQPATDAATASEQSKVPSSAKRSKCLLFSSKFSYHLSFQPTRSRRATRGRLARLHRLVWMAWCTRRSVLGTRCRLLYTRAQNAICVSACELRQIHIFVVLLIGA